MKRPGFLFTFILLAVAQIMINNYLNFSQFLMLTFLPAMILCIPIQKNVFIAMGTAFVCGFCIDFLSDGMLGLTSLALVPVALLRNPVIRLVFGSELFTRDENISFRRLGPGKILLAIVMTTSLFLAVYVWADSAGTRPFWINGVKFLVSLLASSIVSLFATKLLTEENDSLWS